MEAEHREHAVVEQVIADLKDQALAHFPSAHYAANAAWTVIAALAHNMLRWTQLLGLPDTCRRCAGCCDGAPGPTCARCFIGGVWRVGELLDQRTVQGGPVATLSLSNYNQPTQLHKDRLRGSHLSRTT